MLARRWEGVSCFKGLLAGAVFIVCRRCRALGGAELPGVRCHERCGHRRCGSRRERRRLPWQSSGAPSTVAIPSTTHGVHSAARRPLARRPGDGLIPAATQEKVAEADGVARLRAALDAAVGEEADKVAAERRDLALLGQTEKSDKCAHARAHTHMQHARIDTDPCARAPAHASTHNCASMGCL